MGAVHMVVEGVTVLVDEVVTMDVVDIPVAVVVDPVVGHLCRIDPDVVDQIRVGIVDAAIDHPHHHGGRAGGEVPGFQRVDIRIDLATGLADIVHRPQVGQLRIIGGQIGLQPVVILDRFNIGIFPQACLDVPQILARLDGNQLPAGDIPVFQSGWDFESTGFGDIGAVHPGGAWFPLDQQFAGLVGEDFPGLKLVRRPVWCVIQSRWDVGRHGQRRE